MRLDFSDLCRFFSKVKVAGADDCHLWTAKRLPTGYGRFRLRGPGRRDIYAHRLAYLIAHGLDSIPDDLFVLHNCPGGDNPSCVNPAHLWLGTPAENSRDMTAKGRNGSQTHPERWARGERSGAAKLTAASVRQIRRAYTAGGTTYRKLAITHGVSIPTIRRVIRRSTWGHVD